MMLILLEACKRYRRSLEPEGVSMSRCCVKACVLPSGGIEIVAISFLCFQQSREKKKDSGDARGLAAADQKNVVCHRYLTKRCHVKVIFRVLVNFGPWTAACSKAKEAPNFTEEEKIAAWPAARLCEAAGRPCVV